MYINTPYPLPHPLNTSTSFICDVFWQDFVCWDKEGRGISGNIIYLDCISCILLFFLHLGKHSFRIYKKRYQEKKSAVVDKLKAVFLYSLGPDSSTIDHDYQQYFSTQNARYHCFIFYVDLFLFIRIENCFIFEYWDSDFQSLQIIVIFAILLVENYNIKFLVVSIWNVTIQW